MDKTHSPVYQGSRGEFQIVICQLEPEKEKKREISASKLTNSLDIAMCLKVLSLLILGYYLRGKHPERDKKQIQITE